MDTTFVKGLRIMEALALHPEVSGVTSWPGSWG